MDFVECIENSCVKLEIVGETKIDIITELVDLLYENGRINNRDAVLSSVLEREEQISTGLQYGVAMPHGKSDTVDEMVVAIGLKKGGVDFDSLDGKPSQIFIMTISSFLQVNDYIEFLGAVSSVLSHSAKRKLILKASTKEELCDIMTGRGM